MANEMEWADDPGRRDTVDVRCAQPTETPPYAGYQKGCGWKGTAIAVTEDGATSLRPEECPECGGPIE